MSHTKPSSSNLIKATIVICFLLESTSSLLNPSRGNIGVPSSYKRTSSPSECIRYAVNPLDEETPEEQANRLSNIMDIQKAFYQNERQIFRPEHGSTQIVDLPLLRDEWAELPGYQRVLHVHIPNYSHMIHTIINSDTTQKYFGYLSLPGGPDNIDDPSYRLELGTLAPLTGVLMQITDYKQLDDGVLLVVVQALEKFRVIDVKRHGFPYSIATVEIVPDQELQSMHQHHAINVENYQDGSTVFKTMYEGLNHPNAFHHAEAVAEAFRVHPFEVRPVTLREQNVHGEEDMGNVYPLTSYDGSPRKLQKSNTNQNTSFNTEQTIDKLLRMEYEVWIRIDRMMQKLFILSGNDSNEKVPLPYEVLSLLPSTPYKPWPSDFTLEHYAKRVQHDQAVQAMMGTTICRSFIRVDDKYEYNVLRRLQRLSYAVWPLAQIILQDEFDDGFKQSVLEMHSTSDRLSFALSKFERIGYMINGVMDEDAVPVSENEWGKK